MRAYKTPALPPEINTLKSTNSALLKKHIPQFGWHQNY